MCMRYGHEINGMNELKEIWYRMATYHCRAYVTNISGASGEHKRESENKHPMHPHSHFSPINKSNRQKVALLAFWLAGYKQENKKWRWINVWTVWNKMWESSKIPLVKKSIYFRELACYFHFFGVAATVPSNRFLYLVHIRVLHLFYFIIFVLKSKFLIFVFIVSSTGTPATDMKAYQVEVLERLKVWIYYYLVPKRNPMSVVITSWKWK